MVPSARGKAPNPFSIMCCVSLSVPPLHLGTAVWNCPAWVHKWARRNSCVLETLSFGTWPGWLLVCLGLQSLFPLCTGPLPLLHQLRKRAKRNHHTELFWESHCRDLGKVFGSPRSAVVSHTPPFQESLASWFCFGGWRKPPPATAQHKTNAKLLRRDRKRLPLEVSSLPGESVQLWQWL